MREPANKNLLTDVSGLAPTVARSSHRNPSHGVRGEARLWRALCRCIAKRVGAGLSECHRTEPRETCPRRLALLLLLSANPETFCHQNQLGQRFGLHFPHDIAPVNLDRPLAYADLACDLLVHKAARHQCHDLAFARG
jgi:hypothetical protein